MRDIYGEGTASPGPQCDAAVTAASQVADQSKQYFSLSCALTVPGSIACDEPPSMYVSLPLLFTQLVTVGADVSNASHIDTSQCLVTGESILAQGSESRCSHWYGNVEAL